MKRGDFFKKIGYTQQRYSRDLFEFYYKWTETYSYCDTSHQILLSNAIVFNWWIRHFRQLESIAIDIAKDNPNLSKETLKDIYQRKIAKNINYYPKAKIVEALKSVKPKGNQYRTYLQTVN